MRGEEGGGEARVGQFSVVFSIGYRNLECEFYLILIIFRTRGVLSVFYFIAYFYLATWI